MRQMFAQKDTISVKISKILKSMSHSALGSHEWQQNAKQLPDAIFLTEAATYSCKPGTLKDF